MTDQDRRIGAARRWTVATIAVWFTVALVAGAAGVVNEPGKPPLVLLSFFAIPIVGFLLAYAIGPSFRAFTETIPMTLLVGSHLWRFVGIGFVIGWLSGALPGGFGIPEGFGDIIAALGAALLLPSLRRGTAPRGWLLAWNAFGMLDLLSAITVGLLFSQSALGVLSTATSNTAPLVTFPVSIIPTFFVPLFLLVHALIFRRLAGESGPAKGRAAYRRTVA